MSDYIVHLIDTSGFYNRGNNWMEYAAAKFTELEEQETPFSTHIYIPDNGKSIMITPDGYRHIELGDYRLQVIRQNDSPEKRISIAIVQRLFHIAEEYGPFALKFIISTRSRTVFDTIKETMALLTDSYRKEHPGSIDIPYDITIAVPRRQETDGVSKWTSVDIILADAKENIYQPDIDADDYRKVLDLI